MNVKIVGKLIKMVISFYIIKNVNILLNIFYENDLCDFLMLLQI